MAKIIRFPGPAGGRAVQLRYTVESTDRHGNVRLFVRRKGKYQRLHEKPGTPTFLPEYEAKLAILEGRAPAIAIEMPKPASPVVVAQPESFLWLVRKYKASAEFKQLDPSTQTVRGRILDNLCQGHAGKDAHKPYRLLEPQHVKQWRDAKIEAPEAGNSIVKAVRAVFRWAMADDVKLADSNPALQVGKLKPKNKDGHHTWSIGEVATYIARHPFGTKAYLALAIFLFTGVRISDAVRLGKQMEGGPPDERSGAASGCDVWLHFTEAKGAKGETPKARELPVLPILRAAIDAAPSHNLSYLVSEWGTPFKNAKAFGNKFRDWCDQAGLRHCSAHGLRKASATIAADQGASEHALMAIFGWTSPKQAALYTRKADRRRLTAQYMHLLAAMQPPANADAARLKAPAAPHAKAAPTAKSVTPKLPRLGRCHKSGSYPHKNNGALVQVVSRLGPPNRTMYIATSTS